MTALSPASARAPAAGQQSRGPDCSLILGIDPGLYGALALYDPATGALSISDVPTLNVGKAGKRKIIVDEYALARVVDDVAGKVSEVWLEKVGTMPGEGPVGAFSFGRTYGLIRGICCANFLPIHDVTPQSWRASVKVVGNKDCSRQRASALFPRSAHLWTLKKHADRSEAALIAYHGALQRHVREDVPLRATAGRVLA